MHRQDRQAIRRERRQQLGKEGRERAFKPSSKRHASLYPTVTGGGGGGYQQQAGGATTTSGGSGGGGGGGKRRCVGMISIGMMLLLYSFFCQAGAVIGVDFRGEETDDLSTNVRSYPHLNNTTHYLPTYTYITYTPAAAAAAAEAGGSSAVAAVPWYRKRYHGAQAESMFQVCVCGEGVCIHIYIVCVG
jgi:hypothetical protein